MAVHELSLKSQAQAMELDRKLGVDTGRMAKFLAEAAREQGVMPQKIAETRDQVSPENIRKMAQGMQKELTRELAKRLRRLMEKPGVAEVAAACAEMETQCLYAERAITCRDAQLCERFCEWLNLEMCQVTEELWAMTLMAQRMREQLKKQAQDKETVEAHLGWTLYQYAEQLGRIASHIIGDISQRVTEPYGAEK